MITRRRLVQAESLSPAILVSGLWACTLGLLELTVPLAEALRASLRRVFDNVDILWVPEGSLAGIFWVGVWGLGGPWWRL